LGLPWHTSIDGRTTDTLLLESIRFRFSGPQDYPGDQLRCQDTGQTHGQGAAHAATCEADQVARDSACYATQVQVAQA